LSSGGEASGPGAYPGTEASVPLGSASCRGPESASPPPPAEATVKEGRRVSNPYRTRAIARHVPRRNQVARALVWTDRQLARFDRLTDGWVLPWLLWAIFMASLFLLNGALR